MESFRNALLLNGPSELGWKEFFTKEMLDRAVTNLKWRELLEGKEIAVMTSGRSDHNLVLLSTLDEKSNYRGRCNVFRFEAICLLEKEGEKIIEAAWKNDGQGTNSWRNINRKLKNCGEELTKWQTSHRRDSTKELNEKLKLLAQVQTQEGLGVC